MTGWFAYFNVFISLTIIMDPLGNLPFFLLFTAENSVTEQRRMAATASVSAGIILGIFVLSGDLLLRFFGIGLPAFQLAGGFIFFMYALQLLRILPSNIKTSREEEMEGVAKENVALVPLATPLLAGPGAITAVLIWRQKLPSDLDLVFLMGVVAAACLLVYVIFYFAAFIRRVLGFGGIRVITRLMGLLLAVIAVQFMVNGLQELLGR